MGGGGVAVCGDVGGPDGCLVTTAVVAVVGGGGGGGGGGLQGIGDDGARLGTKVLVTVTHYHYQHQHHHHCDCDYYHQSHH